MNDFLFDLSLLDGLELKRLNITLQEIKDVFNAATSKAHPQIGFVYLIGFTSKRKFIHIAYRVAKNIKFDLELLQVDLPYEEDVKNYWCKEQGK